MAVVHSQRSPFLTLTNSRKKVKSVQLLSIVSNPIVGVKNEDVIDGAEPAKMLHLSDSTRTSHDHLHPALLPVCRVFNVVFQQLSEKLEVFRGDIIGRVGLVLCEPPYSTIRVQGQDNGKYDCLLIVDMKDLVDLVAEVMDLVLVDRYYVLPYNLIRGTSCQDVSSRLWTPMMMTRM